MKFSSTALATTGGRSLANPFVGAAIFEPRSLIVALILAVAGCATPERAPELAPTVGIADSVWRQVDGEISAASLAATETAGNYARGLVETWISRVRQRGEENFIPWYTSYWTQQWLAVKVAWYKLNDREGRDSATKRLTAYLEEQYQDRVLDPVAKEVINPDAARRLTTAFYIERLGEQLKEIPPRYGVPQHQFDQRLKAIPAIALAPSPAHRATLYQIVHADPLARQPAYVALIGQSAGGVADTPSDVRMSPVAERSAEKLVAKLAISGGAGAAGAVVGGIVGLVVSAGAAGFSAIAHENERQELEAQLREDLNAALNERSHSLIDDPAHGVMAGVHHIAGQIEGSLGKTPAPPVRDDRPPDDAQTKDGPADQ